MTIIQPDQVERVLTQAENQYAEFSSRAVNYTPGMFDKFKRCIVIGLHRSGTTFTAQAIAREINARYFDEVAIRVDKVDSYQQLTEDNRNSSYVLQAPLMTAYVHLSKYLIDSETVVVFMMRNWADILRSHIKMKGHLMREHVYAKLSHDTLTSRLSAHNIDIDQYTTLQDESIFIKPYYDLFFNYQQDIIENTIALNYDSMKTHPMWKDKEQRINFTRKQIQ